ncbi:Uncharacterized protein PBTT_00502 [Plasmodiophora brassicae]
MASTAVCSRLLLLLVTVSVTCLAHENQADECPMMTRQAPPPQPIPGLRISKYAPGFAAARTAAPAAAYEPAPVTTQATVPPAAAQETYTPIRPMPPPAVASYKPIRTAPPTPPPTQKTYRTIPTTAPAYVVPKRRPAPMYAQAPSTYASTPSRPQEPLYTRQAPSGAPVETVIMVPMVRKRMERIMNGNNPNSNVNVNNVNQNNVNVDNVNGKVNNPNGGANVNNVNQNNVNDKANNPNGGANVNNVNVNNVNRNDVNVDNQNVSNVNQNTANNANQNTVNQNTVNQNTVNQNTVNQNTVSNANRNSVSVNNVDVQNLNNLTALTRDVLMNDQNGNGRHQHGGDSTVFVNQTESRVTVDNGGAVRSSSSSMATRTSGGKTVVLSST